MGIGSFERYTIRPGTEADLDALAAMGAQFFPAVGYDQHFEADADRMMLLGRMLIDAGLLLVAVDSSDYPRGMIGVMLFEHPMAAAKCASEMFWWVDPEVRGSLGLRLLHRAEQWAREQGATRMMMIQPSGKEDVAEIYRHLQYRPVETTYIRRL